LKATKDIEEMPDKYKSEYAAILSVTAVKHTIMPNIES
jgi:hypothetical protein